MARAFLALYRVTADRKWLTRRLHHHQLHRQNFSPKLRHRRQVSSPAVAPTDKAYKPHPQRDENVAVARVANQLFHYTGDAKFEAISKTAMRLSCSRADRHAPPGRRRLLLTEYEVTRPPLHLTVVGAKSDPVAQSLFRAALKYPSFYKRVEWWDTREGNIALIPTFNTHPLRAPPRISVHSEHVRRRFSPPRLSRQR